MVTFQVLQCFNDAIWSSTSYITICLFNVAYVKKYYFLYILDKPHNPMINAGAIVVSSLLKKEMNIADRFDFVSKTVV
jgi:hypothetical protein